MSKEQGNIAKIYNIKKEPKQLSDLIFDIQEKYISQCVASFDEFCINELYKYYQQLGFTKVFVVNRTEFKKFILWALPLWNKHQEQEIELDESQILKAPFTKDVEVKDYIPTKYEKELKALETEFKEQINAIENAQLNVHKFEKAWKIIKEKDVDFYYLSTCNFTGDYNYKVAEYMRLTKQEFDLLKEMLE